MVPSSIIAHRKFCVRSENDNKSDCAQSFRFDNTPATAGLKFVRERGILSFSQLRIWSGRRSIPNVTSSSFSFNVHPVHVPLSRWPTTTAMSRNKDAGGRAQVGSPMRRVGPIRSATVPSSCRWCGLPRRLMPASDRTCNLVLGGRGLTVAPILFVVRCAAGSPFEEFLRRRPRTRHLSASYLRVQIAAAAREKAPFPGAPSLVLTPASALQDGKRQRQ